MPVYCVTVQWYQFWSSLKDVQGLCHPETDWWRGSREEVRTMSNSFSLPETHPVCHTPVIDPPYYFPATSSLPVSTLRQNSRKDDILGSSEALGKIRFSTGHFSFWSH